MVSERCTRFLCCEPHEEEGYIWLEKATTDSEKELPSEYTCDHCIERWKQADWDRSEEAVCWEHIPALGDLGGGMPVGKEPVPKLKVPAANRGRE